MVNESPEVDQETFIDDTTITEQLTTTGEAEPTDVSDDAKQVPCQESSRVDSLFEIVDSPREESTREDRATPPQTPRQRSRSIGEKLVDKSLLRQGRSESLDNLKKVNMRGRVKRRERKAKSDLQLSSSGFVKRHTQIIEEQMLYSSLLNSDETLATVTVGFWKNNGGDCSNEQSGSCQEAQSSQTNVGLATSRTTENSEKPLEESTQVLRGDCGIFEAKNDGCSSGNLTLPDKDGQDNCEENSNSNCDESLKHVPANSSVPENSSGTKRCLELQDIVQEVNAEAKRDIATQPDTTKPLLVSQNEFRPASDSDDVTIDPMTWIDLTHHHGDVVKRRSAAFEKCAKQDPKTGLPPSRDNVPPSRDNVPPSRDDRTDDSTKLDVASPAANTDIPKLDLDDLTENEESTVPRSNSIIVEDYNSWEGSSVRDRTKILENIIAKTGGSFPSPRSRARQNKLSNSEVEGQLQQRMDNLVIDANSEVEKEVISHHSHGEDQKSSSVETSSEQPGDGDVFGDAPVRSLVDKFEDWG